MQYKNIRFNKASFVPQEVWVNFHFTEILKDKRYVSLWPQLEDWKLKASTLKFVVRATKKERPYYYSYYTSAYFKQYLFEYRVLNYSSFCKTSQHIPNIRSIYHLDNHHWFLLIKRRHICQVFNFSSCLQ